MTSPLVSRDVSTRLHHDDERLEDEDPMDNVLEALAPDKGLEGIVPGGCK